MAIRVRVLVTISALLVVTAGGDAHARPISASPASLAATGADGRTPLARYVLPLPGPARVVRPFQPPPTPYSAGHRGVDLATSPGEAVLAAAAGTVTFAGMLAGRGVIVIAHADGISTEYEPVLALIRRGQVVEPGDLIAEVTGAHNGCPADSCLHWGARRDGGYFDPMTLLQPLGPVHLIAW